MPGVITAEDPRVKTIGAAPFLRKTSSSGGNPADATRRRDALGASNVAFRESSLLNLPFADGEFDFVCCSGVLHHLDLQQAYPQLARVLKPNGRILCLEAIGHNPIIRLHLHRRLIFCGLNIILIWTPVRVMAFRFHWRLHKISIRFHSM